MKITSFYVEESLPHCRRTLTKNLLLFTTINSNIIAYFSAGVFFIKMPLIKNDQSFVVPGTHAHFHVCAKGLFQRNADTDGLLGGLNELNPQKMGGNNLLIDLGVFYVLTKPLGTLTILCQQNEGIEITMKIIWDLRHKNACGFWQQHTGKRTNWTGTDV